MTIQRALTVALQLMLVGFGARLLVMDGNLVHTWKLSNDVEAMQTENVQLKLRNTQLENEVADLKTGAAALEARARMSLGMIKKGETFYLVVEPRG